MKNLVINIYEELWDENFTKNILYHNCFNVTEEFIDNLPKKLQKFLFEKKGDGFSIDFSEFLNFNVLDICLMGNKELLDTIINYLENGQLQKIDYTEEIREYPFNSLFIIESMDLDSKKLVHTISEILGKNNIDNEIIKKEESIYERGASGLMITIIIAITSIVSPYIIDKVKDELRKKEEISNYVKYGDFDFNKLFLNFLHKIQDTNKKSFSLYKFERVEDSENYKIIIFGKKARYNIVSDNRANILDLKRIPYETR